MILMSACTKQQGPETKDQHLSRANEYFATNQYEKAAAEYRYVLRLDPVEKTALRQLGTIDYTQGRYLSALLLLKKSAELQPENLDVLLKLGQVYAAGRAVEEARDTLIAVLERQPGDEEALIALANTASDPDDVAEMQATIEYLRDKDKDRVGYHLALGELAMRRKDQATAELEFKAAEALDPKSSAVYFALGNLAWSRNDLKGTAQAFEKASNLAPPRSNERLKYLDFMLLTGDRTGAKSILEGIRQQVPDYLPASVYLMKMTCGEGRKDDCSQSVQAVLTQDPENFDARLISGQLSLAAGDAAKALQHFEEANRINDRNPQALFGLASAYLLKEQSDIVVDKAISNLNVAVGIDPHYIPATLLLSELRIEKGQPGPVIDLMTNVINEQPQIARAHFLLARAYLAQQNQDKALATYRRMMELFPKDPEPPFLAGLLLLDQRQVTEARKAFNKSLEISPDYLPATERLVDLDIADKQYASAINRVRTRIDKDPKLALPWALRAKIELAQQDFPGAEADLLKAIDLDPNFQQAYLLLVRYYVDSKQGEKAIEKLSAFATDHDNVPALMQLAMIHDSMKHVRETRDVYEKLLSIDPKFFPALKNLAVIYSEQPGRLDEAYGLALRAREVARDDPNVADTLGWILFKKGDYRNALSLLQESAAKLPAAPAIQFHLGMAHYMLGDEVQARTALKNAADATEDFVGKKEASQRLALLAIDVAKADSAVRAELQDHLRDRPNDPAALLRLAELQERDGHFDQAMKAYEKVVDNYPQYAPAVRNLAILYSQRGTDDQKAMELLIRARQTRADDPEIAKILGVLNYRRGLYPQSLGLLKLVADKLEDDPELQYYLGMSYYQLKRSSEAEEALNRALKLKLGGKMAEEAQRALADCCQKAVNRRPILTPDRRPILTPLKPDGR